MTSSKANDKFRITVEPVACAAYLLVGLGAPLTDLVMRQSCVALNKDPANCTNDEAVNEKVQQMASTFSMVHIVFDTLPACIMSLFTSPWSNTNGRKPMIIAALLGLMLSQLIQAYLATILTIHPYWLLLASAPVILTGGSMMVFLSSLAYLVDITTNETRTFRIAVLSWTTLLVTIVANFAATGFKKVGYPEGFGLTAIIMLVALLYAVFSLPESVLVNKEKKTRLFTVDHLIVSCKAYFRKRHNNARGIIWCITLCSACALLAGVGEMEVKYLSVIKQFGWDLNTYSIYNSASQAISAFAALAGVYVGSSLLKIDELVCVLFVFLICLTSSILTVLFAQPMAFWIITQFKCFTNCLNPFIKGFVSKFVPKDDVVNILTVMGSVEALTPPLAALMCETKIYQSLPHNKRTAGINIIRPTADSERDTCVSSLSAGEPRRGENPTTPIYPNLRNSSREEFHSFRSVRTYGSKESTTTSCRFVHPCGKQESPLSRKPRQCLSHPQAENPTNAAPDEPDDSRHRPWPPLQADAPTITADTGRAQTTAGGTTPEQLD